MADSVVSFLSENLTQLLKEVVSQIRDVTYEAEDVIDTYIITVTEHRRRSKLRKLIHSCDRAITFHEVAS